MQAGASAGPGAQACTPSAGPAQLEALVSKAGVLALNLQGESGKAEVRDSSPPRAATRGAHWLVGVDKGPEGLGTAWPLTAQGPGQCGAPWPGGCRHFTRIPSQRGATASYGPHRGRHVTFSDVSKSPSREGLGDHLPQGTDTSCVAHEPWRPRQPLPLRTSATARVPELPLPLNTACPRPRREPRTASRTRVTTGSTPSLGGARQLTRRPPAGARWYSWDSAPALASPGPSRRPRSLSISCS